MPELQEKTGLLAPHLAPRKGLFALTGCPIFAVGTWKGRDYTKAHLQEMVEAFEATLIEVQPYAKIGHDDDQRAVTDSPSSSGWAQRDGRPVAGFVSRVYLNEGYESTRTGEKVGAGTRRRPSASSAPSRTPTP